MDDAAAGATRRAEGPVSSMADATITPCQTSRAERTENEWTGETLLGVSGEAGVTFHRRWVELTYSLLPLPRLSVSQQATCHRESDRLKHTLTGRLKGGSGAACEGD